MTIGEKIKHVLEIKGLTQKDLAQKSHLTNATICRYINDSRMPNAENLKILCETLDISADWLLEIRKDI